jgi:hypothetical protein
VLPLSLFVLTLAAIVLASVLLAFFGERPLSFIIAMSCLAAFGLSATLAWIAYGRSVLPLKSVALIPYYLLSKIGQYASAVVRGRTSQWVRTDRG